MDSLSTPLPLNGQCGQSEATQSAEPSFEAAPSVIKSKALPPLSSPRFDKLRAAKGNPSQKAASSVRLLQGDSLSSSPPDDQSFEGADQGATLGNQGENEVRSSLPHSLPMEIRRRIVELNAHFQPVKSVMVAIAEEYGVSVTKGTVIYYDPSRSRKLPKLYRDLHETLRADYIASTSSVAMAHQAHRLRAYQAVYDKAMISKDFSAALKAMELAAKEMGGVMTNASTVTHKGQVEHRHLTIDDARAELAMRISAAIEGGDLVPMVSPVLSVTYDPSAPHTVHATP